jgi:hypothetical protein
MNYDERRKEIVDTVAAVAVAHQEFLCGAGRDSEVVAGTDDDAWEKEFPEVRQVTWRRRGEYVAPVVYLERDFLTKAGFAGGKVQGVKDSDGCEARVVQVDAGMSRLAREAAVEHEVRSHGKYPGAGFLGLGEFLAVVDTFRRSPVGMVRFQAEIAGSVVRNPVEWMRGKLDVINDI